MPEFIVEEFAVSIMEENRPCAGADPIVRDAETPALIAARPYEQVSPQWLRVFDAVDDLRHTLDANKLLTTQPEIAQNFVALLGSLEALRGDTLLESYWRAQLDRMVRLNPIVSDPPPVSHTHGSVYIQQPTVAKYREA